MLQACPPRATVQVRAPPLPTNNEVARSMKIVFATPDLLGYGGIQYCNRLAVQALREAFGSTATVHVITRTDTTESLNAAVGPPCYGADGSRIKLGIKLLQLVNRKDCDALLLMHVNLARLLPLCLRHLPTLVMLYGIDAWRPLPWTVRWGLQRVNRLVSISEHTRQRAVEENAWMKDLRHSICYLGVPPSFACPSTVEASGEKHPYALTIGRMVGAEAL